MGHIEILSDNEKQARFLFADNEKIKDFIDKEPIYYVYTWSHK